AHFGHGGYSWPQGLRVASQAAPPPVSGGSGQVLGREGRRGGGAPAGGPSRPAARGRGARNARAGSVTLGSTPWGRALKKPTGRSRVHSASLGVQPICAGESSPLAPDRTPRTRRGTARQVSGSGKTPRSRRRRP